MAWEYSGASRRTEALIQGEGLLDFHQSALAITNRKLSRARFRAEDVDLFTQALIRNLTSGHCVSPNQLGYSSPESAVEGIGQCLSDAGVEPRLATELVAHLINRKEMPLTYVGEDFDPDASEARREAGVCMMMAPALWWAIRDDDLNLLQCIGTGVSAAAGAGFFLHAGTTLGPATAIAVALFQLLARMKRKGVFLNPAQVQILSALKSHSGGATAAQIATCLASATACGYAWDPEEVEQELQGLTKIRTCDGSVIALTARAFDGGWSAAGV